MVNYALQHGVSQAARYFNTTRPTIYKWLTRFKKDGMKGLYDVSRKPHHSPNKLDHKTIQKILKLRQEFGIISPKKHILGVYCTPRASEKYKTN